MELKNYFNILRKRLWILILLPLITAGIAAYVSFYLSVPIYQANTTLYLISKADPQKQSLAYDQFMVGTQLVKDYSELIKSRMITGMVIDDLKLENITSDQLAGMIGVRSKNETRVIEIVTVSQNPKLAADIANSVAKVFKEKATQLMKAENVNIIDSALEPKVPVRPRPINNIMMAMLAGLLAAIGVIFLLEYLDDTLKTAEDVENHLEVEVLGIIPVLHLK